MVSTEVAVLKAVVVVGNWSVVVVVLTIVAVTVGPGCCTTIVEKYVVPLAIKDVT